MPIDALIGRMTIGDAVAEMLLTCLNRNKRMVLLDMGRREVFRAKNFTPNTVLFSMDNGDCITVKRALEAINYVLGYIAKQNRVTREYSMAKKSSCLR